MLKVSQNARDFYTTGVKFLSLQEEPGHKIFFQRMVKAFYCPRQSEYQSLTTFLSMVRSLIMLLTSCYIVASKQAFEFFNLFTSKKGNLLHENVQILSNLTLFIHIIISI